MSTVPTYGRVGGGGRFPVLQLPRACLQIIFLQPRDLFIFFLSTGMAAGVFVGFSLLAVIAGFILASS